MRPLWEFPFADRAAEVFLGTAASRWAAAGDRAAATRADLPDADVRTMIAREVDATGRRLAAFGVAEGTIAASPGVGTVASASLMAANAVPQLLVLADLIMVIGRFHGLVDDDLALARQAVSDLLWGDTGDSPPLHRRGLAMAGRAIRRLPRTAGSALTRVAISRVSRLAPFGIGAVLGARGGWLLAHRVGEAADAYFTAAGGPSTAEA